MSAARRLRSETAPAHEQVDAAFSGFDLADRASYPDFLTAHGRALPAAELRLGDATEGGALPPWRPRTPLLADDLAALGRPLPPPLDFAPPGGEAGRWGVLYVMEGSRLGGAMLSRRVDPALPSAYLAAAHLPGEWRALLAALDARAAGEGEAWFQDMRAGATACFDLYRRALAPG